MARYRVGSQVKMTKNAIENYGAKWDGVVLRVTHVATNKREHPGYDDGVKGQGLYDLEVASSGRDLPMSLYDWELVSA